MVCVGEGSRDAGKPAEPRGLRPRTAAAAAAVLLAGLAVVVVSCKAATVLVPDVDAQTSAQAQKTLSDSGLVMVVVGEVPSPELPAGSVVSQEPTAGTQVDKGSQVGVVLSNGKPQTTVPALEGIAFQTASSEIASAGLVVGTVRRRHSSTFPPDTVISQNPAADTETSAGSAVDLLISAGPAKVEVPDVLGFSQDRASDKLQALGLAVEVGRRYSSQPRGVVIGEGPGAGSEVPPGSLVTILVSRGPAPVRVPDVIGAAEADAKASIEEAGLVPISVPTSGTPSQVGRVIDQQPDAGAGVAPGAQVRIFVGK